MEAEILSLGGRPMKSEQTLQKEAEEQLRLAEEARVKQEADYKAYQEELEANRFKTQEERDRAIETINILTKIIELRKDHVKTELQNVENPTTGEKQRLRVPVSSFQVSMLDANQMQNTEANLLIRIAELAMKL